MTIARTLTTLTILATCALTALFACPAHAQCSPTTEQLVPLNLGVRLDSPTGTRATVYAAAAWDPDGSGPEPEWFVIGGDFDYVNGIEAHAVAAWDGTRWRSFGLPDLPSTRPIKSLVVHQGRLLAAGLIWTISGTVVGHMFELTTDGWRLFEGRRGPGAFFAFDDPIQCLLSHGNDLYIAGAAVVPDGSSTATWIVRWDGTAYHDMGISLGLNEEINAITMHQGELHVTGRFIGHPANSLRFVARYDGTSWHQLGTGLNGEGLSIFSDGNLLYVGADLPGVDAPSAMSWDGTEWTPAGGPLGGVPRLRAWTLHDGDLVSCGAGGHPDLGTVSELRTWRLREDAWTPITAGASGNGFDTSNDETWSLQHWQGALAAAGGRHGVSSRYTGGVAMLRDGMWTTLDMSMDGGFRSFLRFNDQLIATGAFSSCDGVFSPGACVLTDEGVAPLGAPVRFEGIDHVTVRTAVAWDDRLCLLGNFLVNDPTSTGIIIRDTSGGWAPAPHPYPWFDAWEAVAIDNTLYITTNITGSGQRRGLIALDNAGTWSVIEPASSSTYFYAAIEHNGDLHVSGSFSALGGIHAAGVARYDGNTWHPLGFGLSGTVYDLVEHNGSLWAAGNFTIIESNIATRLARWDGEAWHAVRTPTTSQIVYMKCVGGQLYISNDGRDAFVWNAGTWLPIRWGTSNTGFFDVAELNGRPIALGIASGGLNHAFRVPFALSLPCPTDYVCDGVTDILDFLDFIQAHADCSDGVPACDPIRADFNQDGLVDVLDVLDFIDAMSRGC